LDQEKKRRATVIDVAKLARVSPSAVSRTFTPGAAVSKKTRGRVMKAAEKLDFRPNILARSLITGRSALIAVVTNAFSNPYVVDIIDAFTLELQNRSLRPLVFNLGGAHDGTGTVALMSQYQIDGIVLASSTLSPDFVASVGAASIPTVMAFGRAPAELGISSVYADNVEGGRIAARELLKRGYKNLGFIGGPQNATTTQDRLSGFREQLSQEGAKPAVVVYGSEYSHAAGRKTAIDLLRERPEIEALFCADDLLGVGALDGIRMVLGRAVPKQVGVIGFNDIQMASWDSYNLATLRIHVRDLVVNSIDLLQARIQQGPRMEKRLIGCELVMRGSLRPIPSG
jgi:DNA-binding LacI/PurR family transcriptional regulator